MSLTWAVIKPTGCFHFRAPLCLSWCPDLSGLHLDSHGPCRTCRCPWSETGRWTPTVPALASGYSRYASPISHTPILTLCVLNTHIPPFVSLRSPSRPHRSFPPCSLCGSQVRTILLVAPQHPSWFHSFPLLPRTLLSLLAPWELALFPSISSWALWLIYIPPDIFSSSLPSRFSASASLELVLSRSYHIHSWSGSCVFCFMHSVYYSIPLPCIMHMLIALFHPDYPPLIHRAWIFK